MRVAIVHDYLNEFGGAERVLKVLTEIYPKAPIYTAFRVKNSIAGKEFKGKEIKQSFLALLLKIDNFYSPLRFLTPLVWMHMDLSSYDLVITSSSWYITRGFKVGHKTKIICYCHTPPRWLYGYETSVGFTKYWPVKIYGAIVGHFLRMYDFKTAQSVDYWIANSKNVQARIEKFYRKKSVVIYPPVDVENIIQKTKNLNKENYFLMVSRLVGAKGLEETAKAAKKYKFKLKIVGEAHGFSDVSDQLEKLSGGNIELLGRVSDSKLYELYGKAKGFIALAREEDFGMTVVEAMAAGTPVIAFNGGGFRESVVDGVVGILIDNTDEETIGQAVRKLNRMKWDKSRLQNQARKFSKARFVKDIKRFVELHS
jgi:glycosyltransferase involved in cell wall biosynthesis